MRILSTIGFLIATVAIATAAEVFHNSAAGIMVARGVYLWPGATAIGDFPASGRQLRVVGPDKKTMLQVGYTSASKA